ncbi:hypothetical protein KIPB_007524 [Kipferlia bialata]|uniref:Uncharacterized protein n=1 Tax=Kipferlia bialata TaxID=797122 RepID=A0A9K3D107_9EUKA|nr:hypothetical protein KIPB_007524 [Kipferlia bialata]|eukprot:g7524.t1
MAPMRWYLSCREITIGSSDDIYVAAATLSHNTLLVAWESGQVDRLTVDPTNAEITETTTVLGPSPLKAGLLGVLSCLVSGYNQTVQVSYELIMERSPNGDHIYSATPLEVRVFYPDTGDIRQIGNRGEGDWPQARLGCSVGLVGGTLVVVSGFKPCVVPDGVTVPPSPIPDMWCLDIQCSDSGVRWDRHTIPRRASRTFCNAGLRPAEMCNAGDCVMVSGARHTHSLSLAGERRVERVTYVGKAPQLRIISRTIEVDMDPCICFFFRYVKTNSDPDQYDNLVHMYDRVSGDATLCEPLPYPEEVTCACMLNPTTMIVVQEERLLLVELDPELFNIYTDVD